MEPSQELRAKLFRRLQKIEGAAAEVAYEAARKSAIKEQVAVQPLCHGAAFFRQTSESSDDCTSPRVRQEGTRRRVQVPSWVHDGDPQALQHLQPTQFHMMLRQGSSDGSLASVSTSEQLRRRLKKTQAERDQALHGVELTQAEYECRGVDLEVEAKRLRRLAASLREQLTATKNEVAQRLQNKATGSSCRPATSARFSGSVTEARVLTEELCGQAEQRSALKVRLSSLQDEVQRQADARQRVQAELDARKEKQEDLERRLEELQHKSTKFTKTPSAASSPVMGRSQPGSSSEGTASAVHYDLNEANQSPRGEEAGPNDLEFAYDWGLGLSGRMSVERALRLARWAARNMGDLEPEVNATTEAKDQADSDEAFQGPLAELQKALEVLSSAQGAKPESEELPAESSFEEPIANLQLALSRLTSPQEPDGLQEFEHEVENLQQALSKLTHRSQNHEADDSLVDIPQQVDLKEASDSYAEPIAELEEALGKLGVGKGLLEAGNTTNAPMPTMVPSQREVPVVQGSPPSPLPEAAIALLSPLNVFNPAQALIRKRFSTSDLTLRPPV